MFSAFFHITIRVIRNNYQKSIFKSEIQTKLKIKKRKKKYPSNNLKNVNFVKIVMITHTNQ